MIYRFMRFGNVCFMASFRGLTSGFSGGSSLQLTSKEASVRTPPVPYTTAAV